MNIVSNYYDPLCEKKASTLRLVYLNLSAFLKNTPAR